MGPYKSPGYDGFSPIFFRSNWETIGDSLCKFVANFFKGSISGEEANKTLISLIPKRDKPDRVSHFRPISLCTVHYKCTAKILSQRLKSGLDKLISPFQASFVPGRQIQDNIIIGQEIMHIMKKAKRKKGFIAMKIDLEKAYDRIRWDFLKQVLEEAGLNDKFISLIMRCISNMSYNVLWNGSLSNFFSPQRSLRQGDLISPFLFVLCVDKLSHIISDAVDAGNWTPIHVTKQGPSISHLMFADDLLLFGEATKKHASVMMKCLDAFCLASGEKVNKSKSSIFFSKNVSPQMKGNIKRIAGIKISNEIGRYLGFPLTDDRSSSNKFQLIAERVRSKLASWKSSCLSTAGRIILAKSVLSSIPLYTNILCKLLRYLHLFVMKLKSFKEFHLGKHLV